MRKGLFLVVLIAGCDGATNDSLTDAQTSCIPAGQVRPDHCPNSGCPQTFTTDSAKVCPTDPHIIQPVTFWTGCGDLEVIEYNGVDTGQLIFYRASDGRLVGYGSFSVLGTTCVAGVPANFSLDACSSFTDILCGNP